MGKASSNAGKDYYRRPDYQHLFKEIKEKVKGIPFTTETPTFVDTVVNTEYKDKNGKDLFFRDEVQLQDEKFIIDYDGKQFKWVVKNESKVIMLKEVSKKIVLTKKQKNR